MKGSIGTSLNGVVITPNKQSGRRVDNTPLSLKKPLSYKKRNKYCKSLMNVDGTLNVDINTLPNEIRYMLLEISYGRNGNS